MNLRQRRIKHTRKAVLAGRRRKADDPDNCGGGSEEFEPPTIGLFADDVEEQDSATGPGEDACASPA